MVCDPIVTPFIYLIFINNAEAQAVGLCYGKKWQRLTISQDVVDLYKANGITNMGVPDPIPETLIALKGSNIGIILSIPNDNLQALTDPNEAYKWVVDNVISYIAQVKIRYISVGNEISPFNDGTSQLVPFLAKLAASDNQI